MLQKNLLTLLKKYPDLSQAWYEFLVQNVTDQEVLFLLTLDHAREVEKALGLMEQLGSSFTDQQICMILHYAKTYPFITTLIPLFQKFPNQVKLILEVVEKDDFFYQFYVKDARLCFLRPTTEEELVTQIHLLSKIKPTIQKIDHMNQKELALDLAERLVNDSTDEISIDGKRLEDILSVPDDIFLDYAKTILKKGKAKELLKKYQDILFLKQFSQLDIQRAVYFFLQAHPFVAREKLLQWHQELGDASFIMFLKADSTLRMYLKESGLKEHGALFFQLLVRNKNVQPLLEVLDPDFFQKHFYEMPYDSFLEVFRKVLVRRDKEMICAFLDCYHPLVKEKLRLIGHEKQNHAGILFIQLIENAIFSARTVKALQTISEKQKGWFQESTGEFWYLFRFAPYLLEDPTIRKMVYNWYLSIASEKKFDVEWEMVPEQLKQAVEEDQMRNLTYLMHTKELSHLYEIIEQEPEDAQISKGYQLRKPYQKKRK